MNFFDAIHLALTALKQNRSRAMLTTLGVIIGVGSVIAMMSIGAGARERVTAELDKLGTRHLTVRPGSAVRSGVRTGAGTAERLKLADAEAIGDIPGVFGVVPQVDTDAQVRYRGTNWATRIRGITPHTNWPVIMGDFFLNNMLRAPRMYVCWARQWCVNFSASKIQSAKQS